MSPRDYAGRRREGKSPQRSSVGHERARWSVVSSPPRACGGATVHDGVITELEMARLLLAVRGPSVAPRARWGARVRACLCSRWG